MNKSSVPAMAGVCGVLLFAGTASADFVMLTVELFADNWDSKKPPFPPNIRDVWRVYAHFNDPDDRMTAIGVGIHPTRRSTATTSGSRSITSYAAARDRTFPRLGVSTFLSLARPPVRQQCQQVEDADGTVVLQNTDVENRLICVLTLPAIAVCWT